MPFEFKLPDLGEGLTEGEVARWLVREGQDVAEDDPLVEIQTDKTTVEIPSPAGGVVSRILVEEGQVVPVGTVLVVIGADGAGEPAAPAEPPRTDASVPAASRGQALDQARRDRAAARATPLVRRIAQELGVELDSVAGTGPGGRVTEDDVRMAASAVSGQAPGHGPEGHGGETRVPVRGVRRVIVEHMSRAHREVPAVTWVEECDFSDVDLPLLVPLTLRACARVAARVPRAERAARGRRDRAARPLRPRRRRPDRAGARRAGRPRLRRRARVDELAADVSASPSGTGRDAEAGRAPRLDVHRHERGQARRALPDPARQPPRGRDPERRKDHRPPGRARRRDRRAPHRLRRAHVRPPRRRRRPRGRVRARGDRRLQNPS